MVVRIVRTDVTATVTVTVIEEMTVGIVETIETMETMGMNQLASRATATV
jgi:hypothetical protein